MQLSNSNLTKKTKELKQPNLPNTKPISAASLSGKEPERGLLPVLKNSQFLVLWSGQVFSQLADKVYLVLMIAIIVNQYCYYCCYYYCSCYCYFHSLNKL